MNFVGLDESFFSFRFQEFLFAFVFQNFNYNYDVSRSESCSIYLTLGVLSLLSMQFSGFFFCLFVLFLPDLGSFKSL